MQLVSPWVALGVNGKLTLEVLDVEAAHDDGGRQWAEVGLFCVEERGRRVDRDNTAKCYQMRWQSVVSLRDGGRQVAGKKSRGVLQTGQLRSSPTGIFARVKEDVRRRMRREEIKRG